MLAQAYQPLPRAPAAEQKPPRLLRVNDVAAILGLSRQNAQILMHKLPCINIGSGKRRALWVVKESDFYKWLDDHREVRDQPRLCALPPARRRPTADNAPALDSQGHLLRRR